ncbi:tetratricopeptide repeat protein [Chitinibacter sp. S2-10]|uniref:tetratricopeptide repeat protein n=1 Tax=Chitinibacter sp. S2-10 TaxID=3373597 RepID=UPI003977D82B
MNQKQFQNLLDEFNSENYQIVVDVINKENDKNNFDLENLKAVTLSRMGNYAEAKKSYLRALKLRPDDFETKYNYAKLEKINGNLLAAEELFVQLNKKNSIHVGVLNELGVLAADRGENRSAILHFRQAMLLEPNNARVAKNASTVLTHCGMFDEAIEIVSRFPFDEQPEFILQKATILQLAGRIDQAGDVFAKILNGGMLEQLSPDDVINFYTNYGGHLVEVGRTDEAVKLYEHAIVLDDCSVMAHLNMALFFYKILNDYVRAEYHFDKAKKIDSSDVNVNKWYGSYLRDKGQISDSLFFLHEALKLRPEEPELLYNLSLSELSSGDLAQGWLHHEMRWIRPEGGGKPDYPFPDWEGEDGSGKSILVYREQGLGDEFFFATCLPDLAARFQTVVYACHPKIVTLMSRSYPEVIVIPNRVPRHELALEQFDYRVALGSLPRFLRPDLKSFPAMNRLLLCDPIREHHWRDRLAAYGNTLKVGLAWRSGYVTEFRSKYFLPLKALTSVLAVSGITVVNLQYQITAEERELLDEQLGPNWVYPREIDLYDDLDASASLIKACDVVLSVGTSTAAISGAMGVPTLMFNPMPVEWMQLGTPGYPWLPSISILAKHLEDPWGQVVDQAAFILASLVNEKNQMNF